MWFGESQFESYRRAPAEYMMTTALRETGSEETRSCGRSREKGHTLEKFLHRGDVDDGVGASSQPSPGDSARSTIPHAPDRQRGENH